MISMKRREVGLVNGQKKLGKKEVKQSIGVSYFLFDSDSGDSSFSRNNRYKIKSMEVIRKNPYQLAEDVKGIGFLKADELFFAPARTLR